MLPLSMSIRLNVSSLKVYEEFGYLWKPLIILLLRIEDEIESYCMYLKTCI